MATGTERGRYDRTQSSAERRKLRRERLIRAAAELACSGGAALNVGALVRRARVDRNAFYELFGESRALELAVIDETLARTAAIGVDAAIHRTPTERLRHWLRLWIQLARDERPLLLACLLVGGAPALVDALVAWLERWCEQALATGLLARPPEQLRLQLIAGAIVQAVDLSASRKPTDLANLLADLVLRGLR